MLVDVIRHQHEKLGNALRVLMSLTTPAPQRVAHAVRELALAFRDRPVPEWAAKQVDAIRAIAGAGDNVEARAQALDESQLDAISAAFLELYTVACREYWTA
jgi:hypothetical protein